MQSQIPQLKTLRKKGQNQLEPERCCFFNCKCQFKFLIANARACKGVPFVDLFFAFFKQNFNKENGSFEQGKVFDLVKVCFVFSL